MNGQKIPDTSLKNLIQNTRLIFNLGGKMDSGRRRYASLTLFRILQVWILFVVIVALIFYGILFVQLNIWGNHSTISVISGAAAASLILISLNKENKNRREGFQEEIFFNREKMSLWIVELQDRVEHFSAKMHDQHSYNPSLYEDAGSKDIRRLLYKIREGIGTALYLGDTETAEEFSSKVISTLKKTPWFDMWIKISHAGFIIREKA